MADPVPVPPDLLEILVCPRCKGTLVPTPSQDGLDCLRCRLRYPIRDGIPVMLAEEATPLPSEASPGGPRP